MKSVSAKEVMDKRRKVEGFNNIMFFKLFWTALYIYIYDQSDGRYQNEDYQWGG